MQFEFDYEDFHSAISAAAKVAPTRGAALDTAAGIQLDWSDNDDTVIVSATNLDSTFWRRIPVLDGKGDPQASGVRCRLPSSPFATYISRLPSTDRISLKVTGDMSRQVIVKQGRSKATFNVIETPFPDIPHYTDTDIDVVYVESLGRLLKSVVFASHRSGGPPLDGVHIDGTYLGATDKVRAALAECEIPVEEPITVPLWAISNTFSKQDNIGLAVADGRLVLVLDDNTQLTSRIYVGKYPPLTQAMETARDKVVTGSTIDVNDMIPCLQRINALFGAERYPEVKLKVTKDEIEMKANIPALGDVQEFCPHTTVTFGDDPLAELVISFNPKSLVDMLTAAPEDQVSFGWPDVNNGFLWAGTDSWQAVLAPIVTNNYQPPPPQRKTDGD